MSTETTGSAALTICMKEMDEKLYDAQPATWPAAQYGVKVVFRVESPWAAEAGRLPSPGLSRLSCSGPRGRATAAMLCVLNQCAPMRWRTVTGTRALIMLQLT